MDETNKKKKNQIIIKKDQLTTKSFQASYDIYQRALRYNPNTIVNHPKTPNTTIYIGYCMQLYKS